jgi:hypothetical protein
MNLIDNKHDESELVLLLIEDTLNELENDKSLNKRNEYLIVKYKELITLINKEVEDVKINTLNEYPYDELLNYKLKILDLISIAYTKNNCLTQSIEIDEFVNINYLCK